MLLLSRFEETMRRNKMNCRLREEEMKRAEGELSEPDKLLANSAELGLHVKDSKLFALCQIIRFLTA